MRAQKLRSWKIIFIFTHKGDDGESFGDKEINCQIEGLKRHLFCTQLAVLEKLGSVYVWWEENYFCWMQCIEIV